MMRHGRWLSVCAFALVMFYLVGPVRAGPIANGVGALTGFFGTRSYTFTAGSDTLTADVDYAVYAPTAYPGDDPSTGAHYVYVYQIFNAAASTVDVAFFSVGLEEGSGAANAGDDTSAGAPGTAGGQSPSLEMVSATSVYWLFDPQIAPDALSTTLLFTSPYTPTWKSGAMADGGLPTPGSGLLPSPTPEPATLGLMGVGLAFAVYARGRRRR